MEESKKHPTIPSNYVTLAQLQERWRKEKERKEREKVEEEEREQREKEEQQRKREFQEKKQGQNGNGKGKINSVAINRRGNGRYSRGQSVENCRTVEVNKPGCEEPQFVASVVVMETINDRGQKAKMKNWKWKNRKPRAQEDLNEEKVQLQPESELDENNPVVVTERHGEKVGIRNLSRINDKNLVNGKVLENNQEKEKLEKKSSRNSGKEGITSESRRNGKKMAVTGRVWEQKSPVGRQVEIGLKFEDLSLNDGKDGNKKYMAKMKSGRWKQNWGSGSFNRWYVQKPRDSNLVWVRKEEIYNANAAGNQGSGSLGSF